MASAALPLCAVPESRASLSRAGPAPRSAGPSVAVTGRAAVARPRPAQTAPPLPPPATPRSLPPRSAGRRPLAGGRTPEFPVSWGVCDGRGGGRRVGCLRPHGPRSPPRPPPRPAPRHSGLLPSASNLPKRRQLTLGLSYFLAIFWGFFGAIPAWRSARTGYPFRPARLMRSGITRKWRRKRCGSSFKFVRANPAAPGHAGNAGSLHSWPPFPRLPPRPCCACGKLPHTPTPTPRTCAETSWRQALTSSVPVPRVLRVRVCASVVLVPPWRCSPFRHHSGDTSSLPLGGNKLGSILSVSLKTKQKSNKTLL